ncbi:MAG: SDR family NAD(P)-dependent oxidoreductase [Pseudomonadota bacterium]
MTDPIQPPPRKDPQKRTRIPVRPPVERSRTGTQLSAFAAEGRFALQRCAACGQLQYPAREACARCLSMSLDWQDVDPVGDVIATTTVRTSTVVYFRERTPWRIGTVSLDAGPSIMCHLHGDCGPGDRVRLINRLDKAGHAALLALPLKDTAHMEDDELLRELTCDPKYRRVLITNGRSELGQALAKALSDAGASIVFVGEAESWRPYPGQEALRAIPKVEVLPMDVTDTDSLTELSGEIGGKVDILINNARYVRPGGIMDRHDVNFARDEMDVNYLGLMRLAQTFGPAMRARGADGVNSATAWVNLLSVYALSNLPQFGTFAASNAAALSLSQCLRAEMRSGGVRVLNVFSGPTEDAWHQPLPPPKVAPAALARAVVSALKDGLEEAYVGDVAKDLIDRWRASPKVLEREMTEPDGGA